MNFDYLNEAFRKLSLLDEEVFDTSLEGINELSNFKEQDNIDSFVDVIDPEAHDEETLQDSYIGKVIINCNVCHSHVFEDKEEIVIDEDGVVNSEKECPYCGETMGFTIMGEITEFVAESDEPSTDTKVEVDGEIVPTETNADESNDDDADLTESVSNIDETCELEEGKGSTQFKLPSGLKQIIVGCKKIYKDRATQAAAKHGLNVDNVNTMNSKSIFDEFIKNYGDRWGLSKNGSVVDPTIETVITKFIETDDDSHILWTTDKKYSRFSNRSFNKNIDYNATDDTNEPFELSEAVNNVNVETDDSIVNIESEEDGKVTVSTEPKAPEATSEEAVGPLSDDTITEIESNNDIVDETELADSEIDTDAEMEADTLDIEIDEVDEESLDDLGESYLKAVYENVSSFKTTSVSSNDSQLVVEGVITFNSGVQKNTGFIFEACDATADNKVQFVGKNRHLSEDVKAFTLSGVVKENKLLPESLSYCYKQDNDTSSDVKGTVFTKHRR